MPYITPERRDALDSMEFTPENAGDLNYVISMLIEQYRRTSGESYQTYNDVMGVLEGAKLELYRKLIGPYEDAKILTNGDIEGHADLPWAAGFFDGEGTVGYYCKKQTKKAPKGRLNFGIVQKEPLLLLRFKEAVGNVGYIRQIKGTNGNQYWHYNISRAADIEYVVSLLWPHLGRFKRQDALRALSEYGTSHGWDESRLPQDSHCDWPSVEPGDAVL